MKFFILQLMIRRGYMRMEEQKTSPPFAKIGNYCKILICYPRKCG